MKTIFLAVLFLTNFSFAQEEANISQNDPKFLKDLEADFFKIETQTKAMQNKEPWDRDLLCYVNKSLRKNILEVKDDSKDPRVKPLLKDARNIAKRDAPLCQAKKLSVASLENLARDNGKLNSVLFAIYAVSTGKASERGLTTIFNFTNNVMDTL